MYADDTNVTFSAATIPDLESQINSDPKYIDRWLKANKLSLNVARFGDDSDSTILKFLKFLTKLLGQAILYSAAIIEVWLDKTFVYFNCSTHWNKWPDPLESNGARGYFLRDFMNVGLPQEIIDLRLWNRTRKSVMTEERSG